MTTSNAKIIAIVLEGGPFDGLHDVAEGNRHAIPDCGQLTNGMERIYNYAYTGRVRGEFAIFEYQGATVSTR